MYFRLVNKSYCCERLPCILITSGMPKTEALGGCILEELLFFCIRDDKSKTFKGIMT